MRIEKGVWNAIVTWLKRVNATVRVVRPGGSTVLIMGGADSGWHVQVTVRLEGRMTRRDVATDDDVEVVMCTNAAVTLSRTSDACVNVFIDARRRLMLKTSKSSSTLSTGATPRGRMTSCAGTELSMDEMLEACASIEDVISRGISGDDVTGVLTAVGAPSARVREGALRPRVVYELRNKAEVSAAVGNSPRSMVHLISARGILKVQRGDVMKNTIQSAVCALGSGEDVSGEYAVEWMRAILGLQMSGVQRLALKTYLVFYEDVPPSLVDKGVVGLVGVLYSADDVVQARAIIAPGEVRGRPPIPAQRRIVKQMLNDRKAEAKAQLDNERDIKRARLQEDEED